MADEETGLSFKTADELSSFLMDLQGQISNIQETVDKIQPAESEASEESTEESTDESTEETTEEPTEEEVNEIDKLLQAD